MLSKQLALPHQSMPEEGIPGAKRAPELAEKVNSVPVTEDPKRRRVSAGKEGAAKPKSRDKPPGGKAAAKKLGISSAQASALPPGLVPPAQETFNTPNKDKALIKAKAGSPSDALSVASTVKACPSPLDPGRLAAEKENTDGCKAMPDIAEHPSSALLPHFVAAEANGKAPKPKPVAKKKPSAADGAQPKGKGKRSESKSPIKKKSSKTAGSKDTDPTKKVKVGRKPKVPGEKKGSPVKAPKKAAPEHVVQESSSGKFPASAEDGDLSVQEGSLMIVPVMPIVTAEDDERDGEWRTSGSHFLGRRIIRTVINDDGSSTAANANVSGWLPAEESDFCNDAGLPAALWHVRYEDEALGEEDLEEHEVEEAVRAFELSAKHPAEVSSVSLQAEIDRILVDAPMHIVKKEGAKVGDVAKELAVDVQDLLMLNSPRYAGLKAGSRLKKGTLLFYSSVPISKRSVDLAAAVAPAAATAELGGDSMEVEQSAQQAMPALVPSKQDDSPPMVEEPPKGVLDSVMQQEAIEPRADWHFLKRPVLAFPTYPGVTEADGRLLARKFRRAFTCPFKIVDGVVYATPGFEAVAPITATVEDSWAECDACKKWRRLPPTLIVGEGAEFHCSDIGRSCQDAEDDWDDGEEIEVANDTMKTIEAALPLQLGDLTVTALGEVVSDKAGYWNKSHIFPVGYECTRKYVTDEESKQKTEFACSIEAGDEGPVFRVTPKDEEGNEMPDLGATGKTARSAWVSALAMLKNPALGKGAAQNEGAKRQGGEGADANEPESQTSERLGEQSESVTAATGQDGASTSVHSEGDGMEIEIAAQSVSPSAPQSARAEAEAAVAPVAMQIDDEELSVHKGEAQDDEDTSKGERGFGAATRPAQVDEEEEEGKKKAQINGNALFGFGLARVVELVEALPGSDEIILTRNELRRKENMTLSVPERMRDMPKHLFDDANARVPIRNRANGHILIGKDAPKRKNIYKYLKENVTMEAIDPSKLSKADMAGLQGASQVHICWDCKKGMFASKKNTKIVCRFQLGHTGPDWKNDPRAKADKALDPFAHVRLPASFKYRWKEGCIVTLDYNKQGAPTLVRMPKQFVQDALQVDISWHESVDEHGWPVTEAHLEPREQQAPKRAPRKVYRRPALPVELPENPSGCARAECFVRKSFTAKAEFTHMAQSHFPRLLSPSEYNSMPDARKFQWMKENQNQRLAIGNSGIEGYGIFARRPIYKGEMVVEYTGEAIRPVLADLREERYEAAGIGTYFWRLEEHLGAGEPLEGRAAIVDATVKHNIGHYINHCCDPNCEAKITRINGQRRIIIFAIHDIEFGEELTYDYKLPFEDNKIPCHCGANACRGTLN